MVTVIPTIDTAITITFMSMLIMITSSEDNSNVRKTGLLVNKKFNLQEPRERVWDVLQEEGEVADVKIFSGAGLKNYIRCHKTLTVSPQNTIMRCWLT